MKEIIKDIEKYLNEQIEDFEKTKETLNNEVEIIKKELSNIDKIYGILNEKFKKELENIKKQKKEIISLQEENLKEELKKEFKDIYKAELKFDNKNEQESIFHFGLKSKQIIIQKEFNSQEEMKKYEYNLIKFLKKIFNENYKNYLDKLNEIFKKTDIKNFNEYKELRKSLSVLKEINIEIDLENGSIEEFINDLSFSKIENGVYYKNKDGFFNKIVRAIDLFDWNWGKEEVKYEKYIINLSLNDIKKLIENYKECLKYTFNKRINMVKEKNFEKQEEIKKEIERYKNNKEDKIKIISDTKKEDIIRKIDKYKEDKKYLEKLHKRLKVINE